MEKLTSSAIHWPQSINSEALAAAKRMVKETQTRYPNQPLPPETAKAYQEDWAKRITEIGAEVFERKLIAARNGSSFFPMLDKIDNAEPVSTEARKRRATCRRCVDLNGFIYVMVDGEKTPRAILCKHDPPMPTVRIWINPLQPRQVTAVVCDWVDQQ